MKSIATAISRFARDDEGVTAIEYGLIAALIGVAAMSAMGSVGAALVTRFNTIAGSI
jgi:pilus assembly protein Flp/PilA